jgi:hypothetical protein
MFAEQATLAGSELADKLYTTLKDEDQEPPFEPEDLVQISLLTEPDRTAACNFLYSISPIYRSTKRDLATLKSATSWQKRQSGTSLRLVLSSIGFGF